MRKSRFDLGAIVATSLCVATFGISIGSLFSVRMDGALDEILAAVAASIAGVGALYASGYFSQRPVVDDEWVRQEAHAVVKDFKSVNSDTLADKDADALDDALDELRNLLLLVRRLERPAHLHRQLQRIEEALVSAQNERELRG